MDQVKFKNVVLYLLARAPARPGRMQLLKMLFLADYEHYRRYLRPLTGADYVALPNGPVVDHHEAIFAQLVRDGVLEHREVPISGYANNKIEYLPRQSADLDVFEPTELTVLETVLREHGRSSGASLSQKTHLQGPWSLAWDENQPGRPIPYSLFRWYDNLPDEDDLEAARQAIYARGLDKRIEALNREPLS